MAAVLLFWNINMAAVTSCENALNRLHPSYPVQAFNPESCPHCSFKNPNPGFQGREIPYFEKTYWRPSAEGLSFMCLRTCGETAVTSFVRNFWSSWFALWCKNVFFDLFWSVKLFLSLNKAVRFFITFHRDKLLYLTVSSIDLCFFFFSLLHFLF